MKAGPRLELRQGQSLVMTQQLQQSIKLLQCTSLELREFVEQELEKNPFLGQEEGEGAEQSGEPAAETPVDDGEPREADFDGEGDFSSEIQPSEEWDDSREIESDYLSGGLSISTHSGDYNADEDERGIDDNPSKGISLRDHLLEQLHLDITDPARRLIGAQLIDIMDEAGYIKDDLQPLAKSFDVEITEVEDVLRQLQTFDPPGVCARSLAECLALQLKDKNRLDPAMQCLLDHLNLLAEAKFGELQKQCGVDRDDLKQMVAEIRELNPKPGSDFSHEMSQPIEPDVFVRRLPDGNWHVELNMGNFPKVMVNKRYYKKVTAETRNLQDKKYLSDQFASANWLVRALEQRAQTLLKVGAELVKQQDAFFRLGVKYLKPMTLKDIAAATDYHESTISRVTNGKFMICPRGTFELKYFFTSALARSHGGDDVSSAAVKHHIQELIAKETAILSDDDIVTLLKERNIDVARRTVAKYREALGIPASPKRKRLKSQVF
jgi:RNA polymerase sigma-54 factor